MNKEYQISELDADPSIARKAFRVTKPDGTNYDVILTQFGWECHCLGFLRWSKCKHVAMVKSLATRQLSDINNDA